jgi:4-carboxymuconolactone decarboxylase
MIERRWRVSAACLLLAFTVLRIAAAQGVPSRLKSPRIPPLEEKDWTDTERQLLSPIQSERGSVPNLYKTLARYPKMFPARLAFGRYIQRESSLPPRDREILICRTAWLWNGEYEWSAHTKIAMAQGLSKEDIERIAKGPLAPDWSDFDRALEEAATELYNDTFIGDATWNALAKRYNTHQLMDAVMTVGAYQMLAMAINSFGVPLETGAAGFPGRGGAVTASRPRGQGGVPTRLTHPRIDPAAEASWTTEEREFLAPIKKDRGYVPNVYATMARDPAMYRRWIGFARHILRESSLPAREREMLICRTAWLASGEFEWAAHTRIAKQNGLTDAEIARLVAEPDAPGWSAADATLVHAVDELHYDAFLSDPTWKALAARFDTPQLMDLVFTVGSYKMLAMALNSFGTQLDVDMVGFRK